MSGPAADQLFGNRYRLVERIAGGGMGEVWHGHDEVLGREVAVKILRREYADDPTFLARFRAEARHSAALSHPGIAAVYDFGEGSPGAPSSPFLVMENVPGEALSTLIGREGALGPERTLDIVGQAATALQAAHDAGVIHRDVKPGNILVTPTGTVKITDFGIAHAASSEPLTQTGTIVGTADYISPEQASGRALTPASDIYSLGVVAYECLTGRRPFAGATPVSVAMAQVRDEPPALPDSVPVAVRALVMRMLAKVPDHRPAGAGALGEEAQALRPGPAEAAGRVASTRTMPAVAAAAAAGTGDHPSAGAPTTAAVMDPPRRHHPDTDPGFHLPSPARLPSWLPYAVAVVLFVLALLGLKACGDDPGTVGTVGTAREPSATTAAPVLVDVAAEDYVGRPGDDVRTELEDLGLRVAVDPSVERAPVGTVTGVSPTGALEAESLVRLQVVAPAPPKDDKKPPKGDDQGPGRGRDDDRKDD